MSFYFNDTIKTSRRVYEVFFENLISPY